MAQTQTNQTQTQNKSQKVDFFIQFFEDGDESTWYYVGIKDSVEKVRIDKDLALMEDNLIVLLDQLKTLIKARRLSSDYRYINDKLESIDFKIAEVIAKLLVYARMI